jgi:hypothetical protein
MVEMHGWITIRETYEVTDEDNLQAIVDEINRDLDELECSELKPKWMNGECCFQCSLYTNHWGGRNQDILNIYYLIAKKAIGSYGLLYVHDDESKDDCNSFVVYKLARGKVDMIADTLLSPFIPTVEDSI